MQKYVLQYFQSLRVTSTLLILVYGSIAQSLDLFKETPQFVFYCASSDENSATAVAQCIEDFFLLLQKKFNHSYSTPITISMYPDIQSFHHAIARPDAPNWIIGHSDSHTIKGVSPANPGPDHSYESVLRSYKVSLAQLFIEDMCTNHQSIPRWLHQGVALYISQFFDSNRVRTWLTQHLDTLPTLEQLDAISKNDTLAFDAVEGFRVSYSLIQFIDSQWGWDTVKQLLDNYQNFEKILGISKDEFTTQWKANLRSYD